MAEADVIVVERDERGDIVEDKGGDIDHQLLGLIKTMSTSQKEKLLGSLTEETSVKQEPSESPHVGFSPYVLREIPKLPVFSGTDKDATYSRWKYEVNCLVEESQYSECDIITSVRKSLRSPAADEMIYLGEKATLANILYKLQSLYGTVMSGNTVLEHFYSEPQRVGEPCTKWSTRLEDLCHVAVEKGVVSRESMPTMLRDRFWAGLRDLQIKNALRHRKDSLNFEEIVIEARTLEEEFGNQNAVQVHVQQGQQTEPTLQALVKKVEELEGMIKKRQSRAQMKQRKEPLTCNDCGIPGHLSFGCRKNTGIECHRCKQKGHLSKSCRVHLNAN